MTRTCKLSHIYIHTHIHNNISRSLFSLYISLFQSEGWAFLVFLLVHEHCRARDKCTSRIIIIIIHSHIYIFLNNRLIKWIDAENCNPSKNGWACIQQHFQRLTICNNFLSHHILHTYFWTLWRNAMRRQLLQKKKNFNCDTNRFQII